MMVTFVSQCEKRALKKTRRVLDAFANRIGDNTWQTLITEDGLITVKKMLRQTASKNTAVSCHWIRSRSRSQLLWVVGNRRKFNEEGVVPVNTTRRNLLKSEIENDWHYLPLIKSLTAIAALLHDWGKSTLLFQEKLNPLSKNKYKGDPIRHEWISVLLLHSLVKSSEEAKATKCLSNHCSEPWLEKLSQGNLDEKTLKSQLIAIKSPLGDLPPIAQLIAWLVVSHHRLPLPLDINSFKNDKAETLTATLNRIQQEWGYENRYDEKEYQQRVRDCFRFSNSVLSDSNEWLTKVKRWSKQLIQHQEQAKSCIENGSYRLVLNHARLCLMLGDHYYSSQDAAQNWKSDIGLYANTDRKSNDYKQKLDEHLVGVAHHATQIAHLLPSFEKEPPLAENVQSLRKPSPKAFQWQDKAVTKIQAWQSKNKQTNTACGFFAVNMASTGCGKTFANAKVMRALSSDQKSLRFILALGLRSLTLQTGREYQERVGLDSSELAVQIGSRAVLELEERNNKAVEQNEHETSGSESQEPLLDSEVDYECAIPDDFFKTVLTSNKDKGFLYSPVLACTIDHIMGATETKRGGRYILPTLRLMSSDLVIDEIDDFTDNDLIAIGRLIHLAGMLGRKVMISSATIPPYMAEGYFNAYREGWNLFCQTRDAQPMIGCAWIDEFSTQVTNVANSDIKIAIPNYRIEHKNFIDKRVAQLKTQPAKRKAELVECQSIFPQDPNDQHTRTTNTDVSESKQIAYFRSVFDQAWQLHNSHHVKEEQTELNVSFGVIRIANITPCVQLAKYLLERDYTPDIQVRVMAYHSQQLMLLRSEQEKHLDEVLKRKEKEGEAPMVFSNPVIRSHLAQIKHNQPEVKNVLFILVATPVEEVGRDHDFDWAVIEPSSYRSLIQLAGRVKRHREGGVESPNIGIMQYNIKGIQNVENDNQAVFQKPGFEGAVRLRTKNVGQLIDIEETKKRLDAVPRIQQPEHMQADTIRKTVVAESLADLEHIMNWQWLANYKAKQPNTLNGWLTQTWFLTALPQVLTPFRGDDSTLKVYRVYDEYKQSLYFCEKDDEGHPINRESALNIRKDVLSEVAKQRLWLDRDFKESCEILAKEKGITPYITSLRYGEVRFNFSDKQEFLYSDQLGLVKVYKASIAGLI